MERTPAFGLPARGDKPRKTGLTVVIDFGPDTFGWTGPRGIQDFLDCAADYVDFAKIYAMNALLLPKRTVTEIVKIYRDGGVTPYTGGILFEYAHQRNEIDGLIEHLRSIGVPKLEMSENYIQLTDDERARYFDLFHSKGFSVIAEFGRKNPTAPFDLDELGELVRRNSQHGVEHLLVEQSELDLVREKAPGLMSELQKKPWLSSILIETDPYAFPSQHVALMKQFGRNVNLANVAVGQALRLEGFRQGLGRAVDYAVLAGGMAP